MNKKSGFTLVEIMIVVVIIGLLAAMAIPAFQSVRVGAQAGAVENNLKQIAQTGQRAIIENGLSTVTYDQLITTFAATVTSGPNWTLPYLNKIEPAARESYTNLIVYEDGGWLKTGLKGITPASGTGTYTGTDTNDAQIIIWTY